jgi:hypothetical protein
VPLMLFAKAVFSAHEETRWLAVRWSRPITTVSPGDAPDSPPAPLPAEPYSLHPHTPIMRPHGIAGGSPQKYIISAIIIQPAGINGRTEKYQE